MTSEIDDTFWDARRCMREPVPEVFLAANLLDRAASAHSLQRHDEARELIVQADMMEVRAFTESLWGSKSKTPEQWRYHRKRDVADPAPFFVKSERVSVRMPNRSQMKEIVAHWGYGCAFCGMPLIRKEVRDALNASYPEEAYWRSNANLDQHAALQCMWLQFDHVLPHARGGGNDLKNVVVTCAPCNYGRGDCTLAEYGLLDPRERSPLQTSWDGLERLLGDMNLCR